jgi:hypothetical protein
MFLLGKKNKQLEQEEHLRKIKDYYENHLTGGALNNWSSTVSTTESNQNFGIRYNMGAWVLRRPCFYAVYM